jgi:hypothetical protein
MPAAKKPKKKTVLRIPSTAPAARDERPRLIPLTEKQDTPAKTSEYYAHLAEKLLRTQK